MDNSEKLDMILEKVSKIEIQTAVQQETINFHSAYFRWLSGGSIAGIISIIISIIIILR